MDRIYTTVSRLCSIPNSSSDNDTTVSVPTGCCNTLLRDVVDPHLKRGIRLVLDNDVIPSPNNYGVQSIDEVLSSSRVGTHLTNDFVCGNIVPNSKCDSSVILNREVVPINARWLNVCTNPKTYSPIGIRLTPSRCNMVIMTTCYT